MIQTLKTEGNCFRWTDPSLLMTQLPFPWIQGNRSFISRKV
jgi:hypothetical protein